MNGVKIRAIENFISKLIADVAIHEALDAQRVRVVGIANPFENLIFEVHPVHVSRQTDLAQVADAIGTFGLLLRRGENGQKHRSKDGDDRNDHQKFDEREGKSGFPHAGTLKQGDRARFHKVWHIS
jgi:hypothetical protein